MIAPDLVVRRLVSWPRPFDIGPDGLRENQGVEGLAATPDGRLIGAIERPLGRDLPFVLVNGRPFSNGQAGLGRFVEFVRDGPGWRPEWQWAYPIGATAMRPGFDAICDDGENGLSDLLALDDATFLSLERACLLNRATKVARNTASIYYVSLARADDVRGVDRLDPARVRAAAKELVLDLDTLRPSLPANLQGLENFETLAFGPPLADGRRTLLLVSDDNFNANQKTAFLLFRID
jgi:hypothetical protein